MRFGAEHVAVGEPGRDGNEENRDEHHEEESYSYSASDRHVRARLSGKQERLSKLEDDGSRSKGDAVDLRVQSDSSTSRIVRNCSSVIWPSANRRPRIQSAP